MIRNGVVADCHQIGTRHVSRVATDGLDETVVSAQNNVDATLKISVLNKKKASKDLTASQRFGSTVVLNPRDAPAATVRALQPP
jgi:hypothetical protein